MLFFLPFCILTVCRAQRGGPAAGGTARVRRESRRNAEFPQVGRSPISPPAGEVSALALTEGDLGGALFRKRFTPLEDVN